MRPVTLSACLHGWLPCCGWCRIFMPDLEFRRVRGKDAYRNLRGLEVVVIDSADDIPRLVFGLR